MVKFGVSLIEEWRDNRTVYWIYLPKAYLQDYKNFTHEEWNGTISLYEIYLQDECGVSKSDAGTYTHHDSLIPRNVLSSLLPSFAEGN